MSAPFVGEIRMFGGNFAPAGWMFCDGQLLPISENEVLFQLIGTTYGGDGQNTFALPNLQSRFPLHPGTGGGGTYQLGETGGVEEVTLTVSQIPAHSHAPVGNDAGGSDSATNNAWGKSNNGKPYGPTIASPVLMNAAVVQSTGGSQPHENMPPFLVVSFIISLFGIFPSPN